MDILENLEQESSTLSVDWALFDRGIRGFAERVNYLLPETSRTLLITYLINEQQTHGSTSQVETRHERYCQLTAEHPASNAVMDVHQRSRHYCADSIFSNLEGLKGRTKPEVQDGEEPSIAATQSSFYPCEDIVIANIRIKKLLHAITRMKKECEISEKKSFDTITRMNLERDTSDKETFETITRIKVERDTFQKKTFGTIKQMKLERDTFEKETFDTITKMKEEHQSYKRETQSTLKTQSELIKNLDNQSNLAKPLVEVGRKVRHRFLERARYDQVRRLRYYTPEEKLDRTVTDAGDDAAHRGNMEADMAMFSLGFLDASKNVVVAANEQPKTLNDVFLGVYGNRMFKMPLSLINKRVAELFSLRGSMATCGSFTKNSLTTSEDERFLILQREWIALHNASLKSPDQDVSTQLEDIRRKAMDIVKARVEKARKNCFN